MVEVRYKARLANNLFQYCLGRILAEEMGFALQAAAIPGFPNTTQSVAGGCHAGSEQVLTGQRIDFEGILADRSPRRIILDGWFQRYEYYRPYRQQIRRWLTLDPAIQVLNVRPDLVLNVRRTDYIALGWALPFSYYDEAIRRALPGGGNIWIVTDDRWDPFFRQFKRWRPKFFSGSALQQIAFMMRAPRLVLSQSTFSWWPTFLGDVQEIIAPIPSTGAWSEASDGDTANLIERDRFVCVECREAYRPTRNEQRHQKWRSLKRRSILKANRVFGFSLPEPSP